METTGFMKSRLRRFIFEAILGLALVSARQVWGAACCGGTSAIPSLISGDDWAQFSVGLTEAQVVGDAPAAGIPVFRSDGDTEVAETLMINGALQLTDGLQGGIGVPVIRRARSVSNMQASSAGLADIELDLAYEILPDQTYSVWRPHGFAFVEATLPTSPSIYEATAPFLIDARGRGFFSSGGGFALFKETGNFDAILVAEGHRSFSRSVTLPDGTPLRLMPGWGGSLLLGAGYSPGMGNFRVGASLSPIYEGSIGTSGGFEDESSAQLVWNASVQLGYLVTREWSASLSYLDQTLVGPARNISLSRGISLFLQRRWQL